MLTHLCVGCEWCHRPERKMPSDPIADACCYQERTLLVLIGSFESIRSIYAATRCCQQDFKSPLWIWTPAAECQMPSESIRSDHCCSQEDAAPDFNWLIWIRPLLPNHCQMIYQVDTGTEGGPLGTRWWDNDGWFHDMQTCFPLSWVRVIL